MTIQKLEETLKHFATVKEASEITGISVRGIQWNCEHGKYKCTKLGRDWLILKSSL